MTTWGQTIAQMFYLLTKVVMLRGASCTVPVVVPTGFRVSPETSDVRYICHLPSVVSEKPSDNAFRSSL